MDKLSLRKTILGGAALVLVVAGLYVLSPRHGRGAGAKARIAPGGVAPQFSLPDLAGHDIHLIDYRGKVVLLDFWATWCSPCRDEIPHLVELQNKYGERGLQIIGVSMDDEPAPVREFSERYKMNYPVVLGNAKTGELYGGVLGLPIAFVIDRNGRIYSKHIGATDIFVFEKEITKLLQS